MVNRQQVPVPLTSRRQEVVVVQHLVPAPPPAEEWLAVLTFSTPDVAGQDEFVELVGRIAAGAGVPRRGRVPAAAGRAADRHDRFRAGLSAGRRDSADG